MHRSILSHGGLKDCAHDMMLTDLTGWLFQLSLMFIAFQAVKNRDDGHQWLVWIWLNTFSSLKNKAECFCWLMLPSASVSTVYPRFAQFMAWDHHRFINSCKMSYVRFGLSEKSRTTSKSVGKSWWILNQRWWFKTGVYPIFKHINHHPIQN